MSKSSKNGASSLAALVRNYEFVREMTRAQRVAHFLDKAAREFPHVPIPLSLICQAVHGYPRKPTVDEVEGMRGSMHGVRKVLLRDYERDLFSVRGEGFLATVDSTHAAGTTVRRSAARVVSAHKSLVSARSIVDVSKVKDPNLQKWLRGSVDTALKALDTDDRVAKLLLPPVPPKVS
jgi:hypothetical protein